MELLGPILILRSKTRCAFPPQVPERLITGQNVLRMGKLLEDSEKGEIGVKDQPLKSRRKPNLVLVLITISIAAIMVLSGLILNGARVQDQVIFNSGDYFHYEISGKTNSTPIEGNETINVRDGGYSSSSYGDMLPRSEMGQYRWYDQIGDWVGNHRISTKWGEKTAKLYLKIDSTKTIVLTDVGIDSSIIYRTTCLKVNGTLKSTLTASNNTNINDSDARINDDSASGLGKIDDSVPTFYTFDPGGGFSMCGSVRVSEGQSVGYNLTDSGAFLYFFSQGDLYATSNGNDTIKEQGLSMELNDTGKVEKQVPAGTYWYCLVIENSTGGGFWPSWQTTLVS
jgi:hypothetical protein